MNAAQSSASQLISIPAKSPWLMLEFPFLIGLGTYPSGTPMEQIWLNSRKRIEDGRNCLDDHHYHTYNNVYICILYIILYVFIRIFISKFILYSDLDLDLHICISFSIVYECDTPHSNMANHHAFPVEIAKSGYNHHWTNPLNHHYVCMYIYIYICMSLCIYIYIYIYICVYVRFRITGFPPTFSDDLSGASWLHPAGNSILSVLFCLTFQFDLHHCVFLLLNWYYPGTAQFWHFICALLGCPPNNTFPVVPATLIARVLDHLLHCNFGLDLGGSWHRPAALPDQLSAGLHVHEPRHCSLPVYLSLLQILPQHWEGDKGDRGQGLDVSGFCTSEGGSYFRGSKSQPWNVC